MAINTEFLKAINSATLDHKDTTISFGFLFEIGKERIECLCNEPFFFL